MTQNIQQWLAEIQGLQQKLVEVHQERDQAYASAANWRNLYETEAKQRRQDALTAKETIDALRAELNQQQTADPNTAEHADLIRHQVAQWQSIEELQTQLMQVLLERDQLIQSLKEEQQAHLQTRQDLTTALGDTIEQLTRTQSGQTNHKATVIPMVHRSKEG